MNHHPTFRISDRVAQVDEIRPYRRKRTDPVSRPLRVFALDPAESQRVGALATIEVPFEPLRPGPIGTRFKVDDYDSAACVRYHPVDLDHRDVLIANGLRPSVMDPRSHQQMVYAVAMQTYGTFRSALGRELQWGFHRRDDEARLILRPHFRKMRNGYYDKEDGSINFGYYDASEAPPGRNLPGGDVFTCLSHDIVTHELTHALLDGLRPSFGIATNPDMLAFHEGFSDLVAVFQKFTYPKVVKAAIAKSRGSLGQASVLTDVARQFGHTIGAGQALRSAIDTQRLAQDEGDDSAPPAVTYRRGHGDEPHALGSVLLSAVFDAFNCIFERKTQHYIRLATGGSGILPPGALPNDLINILAEEASKLAKQFLSICIRAIDYCPPVDLTFGDYLRAMITADHDLVESDPWGYREALIDAFRMREIFPLDVSTLSEDSLLWDTGIGDSELSNHELSFAELHFRGDPANPMSAEEEVHRARILGQFITDPRRAPQFGLGVDHRLGTDCDPVIIESLRTSRRIGPDGQIQFDLVAEVVQQRRVEGSSNRQIPFYGGATIIFDSMGKIRYSIGKDVCSDGRAKRQDSFIANSNNRYWLFDPLTQTMQPNPKQLQLIHEH